MVSGSNRKNTGNKPKTKQKMELAKNPTQLALAIIVVLVFIGKSGYDLFNYMHQQQVEKQREKQAAAMTSDQQKDLESLAGNPAGGTVSPDGSVPPDSNMQTGPNVPAGQNEQADANDIYAKTLSLQGRTPDQAQPPQPGQGPAAVSNQDVEIVSKQPLKPRSGKMKLITVVDSGRSNPFLPAAENYVPSALPKLSLLAPPEQLSVNSEADKVMGTTISGILYDKYSPSAIINIDKVDYLVKRGDVINKYKILSISKDQVVVQLGQNVYKAGVGQLLQPDKMNYNTISNLNKKFGGNEVSVGVKKKSY